MKLTLAVFALLFCGGCITIYQGDKPTKEPKHESHAALSAVLSPEENVLFVDPSDGLTYRWVKIRVYADQLAPLKTQAFAVRITPKTGSFKDERDGQVYHTVTIGKQTWMAQNLNYKTSSSQYYNDDPKNGPIYGMLYKYSSLNDACPKGWHVPTDAEWEELEFNTGMNAADTSRQQFRGSIASSFFPGGITKMNILFGGQWGRGQFSSLEESAYFWTSSRIGNPIISRIFRKGVSQICKNSNGEGYNLSVRCVKDK